LLYAIPNRHNASGLFFSASAANISNGVSLQICELMAFFPSSVLMDLVSSTCLPKVSENLSLAINFPDEKANAIDKNKSKKISHIFC
jgi:hypothetical protein